MRVEILHIDDCPNWVEASARTRAALDAAGFTGTAVEYVLLTTPDEASATAFGGSPTIAVDGEDLFPTAGAIGELACRVYVTPTGLAGLPTIGQITAALHA